MLTLTLRSLGARKRRFVGTFLAIFLGVAFLSGTLVLGDTLTANFDRLFADANAGTDVVVRAADKIPGERRLESGRGLVPASLVDQVAAVEGVAAAAPEVSGYGQLIDAKGKAVGGNGPPTLAGNWIGDAKLNPWRLVEGRAPASGDEVVVNRGAAKKAGFEVGDTVTVRTPDPVQATIVGIATFGTADGFGTATYTAFTTEAAERYLTPRSGQISRVLVRADGKVSQHTLAARIRPALPGNLEAITGKDLSRENLSDLASGFLGFFRTFLLVFSGIALLVATFSIFNTFSIIVAQRRRESALLRALGASQRQILGSVVAETAVVGIVASVLGALGGLGIAGLLKGLFDAAGFSLPAGGLSVNLGRTIAAVVVGLAVTVAAGLAPALKASRTLPLSALRDAAVDRSGASRLRAVAGAVLVAAGMGVVVVAIASGGANALGPAGLGAIGTLVGVVVLGPVVAGPASGALGSLLPRLRGVTGSMARHNAMRNPRRTSGTAAALMVGVTVVTLFTVFAASLKASVDDRVTRSVTADFVVSPGGFGGGLSPRLAGDVAARPEVAAAVGLGIGVARVDSHAAQLSVADPAGLARLVDLDVRAGSLAGLAPGELAVSKSVADDRHWTAGTRVPVTFTDGSTVPFTIGAVYERSDVAGNYLMSRQAWRPHAVQDIDTLVLIALKPGVTAPAGRAAVTTVASAYGGPKVMTKGEFIDETAGFVNTALGIVYVMLGLAIFIALMGIANTLSLSIHERTRELGLLRAVGETRTQVRSMVRWESVIIAVFGTLGGLGMGVFLGWALVQAAAGTDFVNRFAAPAGQLVVVLAAGALAGVLAGVRPARRAAGLDILSAIATV